MLLFARQQKLITNADEALPGRDRAVRSGNRHYVTGLPVKPPFPTGLNQAVFALGCFWGAEQLFWQRHGVYTTASGYAGGYTPNPTYEEVCSGLTGHAEAVLVVFDPVAVTYRQLLKSFWEAHDPTQGLRQGNDTGTQYRSAIYTLDPAQHYAAEHSRQAYQRALTRADKGRITTEIKSLVAFYYAEKAHQQFLAKHLGGYCGLQSTGVSCSA